MPFKGAQPDTLQPPTPAETAYHLQTTDFLVTLNKQQSEQYAVLMEKVVDGMRNDMGYAGKNVLGTARRNK
jgi:hypothetical protein